MLILKMKVLFLDHDGVICLDKNFGGRFKKQKKISLDSSSSYKSFPVSSRFDNFDKKSILVLNEIIHFTNCEIVVSSDWRSWATVEEMGDYYEQQGIIKKPIGYTPNSYKIQEKSEWNPSLDLEISRSLEINEFLNTNLNISKWVAVDDLDMSIKNIGDFGLPNFVHTPKSSEGIKQIGIKEKIILFLNR
jgi:hypothetical protein